MGGKCLVLSKIQLLRNGMFWKKRQLKESVYFVFCQKKQAKYEYIKFPLITCFCIFETSAYISFIKMVYTVSRIVDCLWNKYEEIDSHRNIDIFQSGILGNMNILIVFHNILRNTKV